MEMIALQPVLASKDQESRIDRAEWHSQARGSEKETDEVILKRLIEQHFRFTGSACARSLLDDWATGRSKFVKVFPHEYRRALLDMSSKAAVADAETIAA
jgi:glutamate synthase (NADPH/NADH) large chain